MSHPPGGHRPPPPGEDQPLRPGRTARQGGGGSGFVNVNSRLFAPLQGLNPANVLMGGYGWLDKTDGGATYHPGLDLNSGSGCNADEGALVVAPLAGVVRATLFWNGYSAGEGNHVWVELDDPCLPGPTWWHTDHLQSISVGLGQRLVPGQPIGPCGRSGGWDCAHAHTELLTGPPYYGWYQWPYGWSRAQVEANYWNPSQWWAAASALVLAEGNQPIPPEVVAVLTDWQIKNWIMPDLWQWQGIDYNPEAGTSQGWVNALRAGHYLGRPRTGERPYGEGNEAGVWVEHEHGLLVYRFSDDQASWTG
jgi:hypothetical protein